MIRTLLIFLICTCIAGIKVSAQTRPLSNFRKQRISTRSDSITLDTLSIVPGTLRIEGIAPALYRFEWTTATIHWLGLRTVDSLTVAYRVFPFNATAARQPLRYDSIASYKFIRAPEPPSSSPSLFNFGKLNYAGSFGRGLSFGNNQDAVVTSDFQLQVDGFIGDSIELTAAVTDNNIPIQPDGTTQQLNEFDQIFLQFKKKHWQLNLGDLDLRQNDLYFLNFYKRLEGVAFTTDYKLGSAVRAKTLVSGAIAKGKFTRNILAPTEGNQGPYRLTGANGETFFIVLPNTERVFLDGALLQRGEDADYIINYNTAEVTFMPRRMITKDARIQVEFEYADRNFLNSTLYSSQALEGKNWKINVGAYRNGDARNSSINQTLNPEQKRFLSTIGDSLQQALYPSGVPLAFAPDRVLYEKVFTNVGGVVDSFYRYSADSTLPLFSVSFSPVGAGRGRYVEERAVRNTVVYRYTGAFGGTHEPVTFLVTPKMQSVVSTAGEMQLTKTTQLKGEFGLSSYDLNTFSKEDSRDDRGTALRLQLLQDVKFTSAALQLTADYESVNQRFRPLERLRYVEFGRDWGLALVLPPADEKILRASAKLQSKTGGTLAWQGIHYSRSNGYTGMQNLVSGARNGKLSTLQGQLGFTRFESGLERGTVWRPTLEASRRLPKAGNLQVGMRYFLERNDVRNISTDSVTALSFSFDQTSLWIKTDERLPNKLGFSFFTRKDQYPGQKRLETGDRSYNYSVAGELRKNPAHQAVFSATYRQLRVHNEDLSPADSENSLLGRAEYNVREWKGALTSGVLYELGAGQEQRRDLAYFEVPAGRGEYTWIDYDSNGVQSLDEFEVAAFRDQAKYVRLFVPTNQFVRASFTTLNYNVQFSPRLLLPKELKSLPLKWLSLLSIQSALQKSRRIASDGDIDANPFKLNLEDTSLISMNTIFNNTLSLNRYSAAWGIDLTSLQNNQKSLLTYGYETRTQTEWGLRGRWQWTRRSTQNISLQLGSQSLDAGLFENRNFELRTEAISSQWIYTAGTKFRLQGSTELSRKENQDPNGTEKSTAIETELEAKYNLLQSGAITLRATQNHIKYDAGTRGLNSAVSYQILEGLLPGQNFLWTVELTRRIFGNIELQVQYDGRKPAATRSIHTGRASVRALF